MIEVDHREENNKNSKQVTCSIANLALKMALVAVCVDNKMSLINEVKKQNPGTNSQWFARFVKKIQFPGMNAIEGRKCV